MKIGDLDKDVKLLQQSLFQALKIFDKDFKVIDAIMASCSIPGITTPYIVGEEMYCDGGILNNFPADIIINECDKLIEVFVSPSHNIKIGDLKSIKSIVSHSYDLLSYRVEKTKSEHCDWFILLQDYYQASELLKEKKTV